MLKIVVVQTCQGQLEFIQEIICGAPLLVCMGKLLIILIIRLKLIMREN